MDKSNSATTIRKIWKNADAVCFDVDSTVITGEGIDELAVYCGVGKEVKEWTNKAMGGGVTFQESLHARLKIINPSKNQLETFIKEHPPTFTPYVEDLVHLLQTKNVDVYLVSGGFQAIIKPLADKLNIPHENIFANRFIFNADGSYSSFDDKQPTSATGGKRVVVEDLLKNKGYKNLVTIGDGITDYETYPPAHLFIGFGGNKLREKVKQFAPWFVYDFKELIDILQSS